MKRLTVVLAAVVLTALVGCAKTEPVTLRVLTYNIHHGAGMDGRIDLERIAEVIRQSEADLVALQEIERGVQRSGGVDEPARLAELTGMQAVFEKNITFQGGEFGNAVLSRRPVEFQKYHPLPNSPGGEQRGVLEVHVRVGGQKLIFLATHFDHRGPDGDRLASVGALRKLVDDRKGVPIILAGDLNATPDSRVLAELTTSLANPCPVSPDANSYPADKPAQRIDYVLFNEFPGWRSTECRVIPELAASDHRPVLAVFQVEASRR